MNRKTHASVPGIEKSSNSRRIWKPTPLEEPKTSVSCSTFHARANESRTPANANGVTVGIKTCRTIADRLRPNASLIVTSLRSTESSPSATLIATYGIDTSATEITGPRIEIPNSTRASTAYVMPGMLPATITMSWKKARHHELVPIR
jgi:hypothetical protein